MIPKETGKNAYANFGWKKKYSALTEYLSVETASKTPHHFFKK